MLFLFKLFLLYRKLAYLSRLIPKKEALASFFLFIDLVAVFTTQEEISIFLANKGQVHIVPIFLLEVHDQFYLV